MHTSSLKFNAPTYSHSVDWLLLGLFFTPETRRNFLPPVSSHLRIDLPFWNISESELTQQSQDKSNKCWVWNVGKQTIKHYRISCTSWVHPTQMKELWINYKRKIKSQECHFLTFSTHSPKLMKRERFTNYETIHHYLSRFRGLTCFYNCN